jgi:hypothetical protein
MRRTDQVQGDLGVRPSHEASVTARAGSPHGSARTWGRADVAAQAVWLAERAELEALVIHLEEAPGLPGAVKRGRDEEGSVEELEHGLHRRRVGAPSSAAA